MMSDYNLTERMQKEQDARKPQEEARIREALAAKGYNVIKATHELEWFEPLHPTMVTLGDVEVEGVTIPWKQKGETLPGWHGGWMITVDPPIRKAPPMQDYATFSGRVDGLLKWIAEFPQAGEIFDEPDDGFVGHATPMSVWANLEEDESEAEEPDNT